MPEPLSTVGLLACLALAVAPRTGDSVQLERSRFEELTRRPEPQATRLPAPWASYRELELVEVEGGVTVHARWTIRTFEAGWFAGVVLGRVPGARVELLRWQGREVALAAGEEGEVVVRQFADDRSGVLEMRAFVPRESPGQSVSLSLLPAVRGELKVRAGERRGEVRVDGASTALPRVRGRFWTGAERLQIDFVDAEVDESAAGSVEALAVGRSALGLTFAEGELRGRARVTWEVRRGTLARVELDTREVGGDLELTGANVGGWTRDGDHIRVELREPESRRVELELRWTRALPAGDESRVALARVEPGQAWRVERFLQVARDGEIEVIPALTGWESVPVARLPDWAGGLIEGSATAAFHGREAAADASFDLLRFVPVAGPAVVVDVAAYELAASDEGRSLLRAQYEVRNERASHLRLTPPPGMRIIGVRVAGEAATPSQDRDGSWRIPLVRSIESVEGLLSFPVEAVFLGDGPDWERRERRQIALPSVDAPVAASRTRLFLPPGWRSTLEPGTRGSVASFTEGEGITYGLGAGNLAVAEADLKYRGALSSYLANDFEAAEQQLEELDELGASNRNIAGLRANLDVIRGEGKNAESGEKKDAAKTVVLERRIKEQAQARAVDDKREQLKIAEEGEKLEAEGRFDEAEAKLTEALELGDRLAMLEHEESVEQAALNEELSVKLGKVAERKQRRARQDDASRSRGHRASDLPTSTMTKQKAPAREDLAVAQTTVDLDFATALPTVGDPSAAVVGTPLPPSSGEDLEIDGATGEAFPEPMPAAPADDQPTGISLPGGGKGMPSMEFDDEDRSSGAEMQHAAPGTSRRRHAARARRRVQRDATAPAEFEAGGGGVGAGAPASTPMPAASAAKAEKDFALPEPIVTASALAVVVPAIGEEVLYQRLLLAAGEQQLLTVEARASIRLSKRNTQP